MKESYKKEIKTIYNEIKVFFYLFSKTTSNI